MEKNTQGRKIKDKLPNKTKHACDITIEHQKQNRKN
jgi:hypothetical protein